MLHNNLLHFDKIHLAYQPILRQSKPFTSFFSRPRGQSSYGGITNKRKHAIPDVQEFLLPEKIRLRAYMK